MRSNRFKIRLLIGAAIVVFAYVQRCSRKETNPFTGRVQAISMTSDQEIAIGLQNAPIMEQQHGGQYPNKSYQDFVDQVGHKLVNNSIAKDKWSFSYAEGKWTIKEILLHLIDAERVFAYRTLCVSRKEELELPGFDHDEYLKNSNAKSRSHESLIEEYEAVRKASISLFKSFDEETLSYLGVANGSAISVKGLAYIIAGHELHHNSVIKERYL